MTRYVSFLRGMNLGGRRVKNEEICACFETMTFRNVTAFLASCNVIFDAHRGGSAELSARIEKGLRTALGYDVPTFLRSAREVRAIVAHEAFPKEVLSSAGRLQVALLPRKPSASACQKTLALATERDRLAIHGREFYWLPSGKITESGLDLKSIESALGPWTMRTRRAIERIAANYLRD